jgi:hypothetical protein
LEKRRRSITESTPFSNPPFSPNFYCFVEESKKISYIIRPVKYQSSGFEWKRLNKTMDLADISIIYHIGLVLGVIWIFVSLGWSNNLLFFLSFFYLYKVRF